MWVPVRLVFEAACCGAKVVPHPCPLMTLFPRQCPLELCQLQLAFVGADCMLQGPEIYRDCPCVLMLGHCMEAALGHEVFDVVLC